MTTRPIDLTQPERDAPEESGFGISVIVERLLRSPWVRPALRYGAAPVVPKVSALPTAGAEYRGGLYRVEGDGSTTNDGLYLCRLLSTGSYEWTAILSP